MRRSWPILLPILAVAFPLFTIGITWGLPADRADAFLFGTHPKWTGSQILTLAPSWSDDASRGADVAAHPLGDRDRPQIVNATDQDRAAIVRRYRLYSDQPDEMITLRALAQMKPGKLQLDPRLYQYGGLWIYPIGALLKAASLAHLIRLTPDLAFYLNHPEAFGRLYVVMRLYSLAWGMLGVAVIFTLARRISQSRIIGTVAAVCYLLLPTVINGAHEAKPHLAGAVLGLLAVDLAIRALGSGLRRHVIATGIACGAAASMVLSGWTTILMLPVMAYFMPRSRFRVWVTATLSAIVMYALCNPYVVIHLFGDRTVLNSNLGNSAAMYQTPATLAGVFHSVQLLYDSGSTVVIFGICAIVIGALKKSKTAWLLFAGTLPGLIVFAMHATAKPGEYGRFALPMDVLLVMAVAVGLRVFKRSRERALAGAVLCLMLVPSAMSYVWHYGRETFDQSTRLIVADRLSELSAAGATVLAVDAEPAPYTLPPVDLFRWKILLLPRGSPMPADADVRIDPVDDVEPAEANVHYWIRPRLLPTPISWAAKPFRIETRLPNLIDAAPAAPVH